MHVRHGNDVASLSAVVMESEVDVAGLRDFLGSEWLQDDTLDACNRLLQEASLSDVYEAAEVGATPRSTATQTSHTSL